MDRGFLTELRRIVGDTSVLDDALELLTYECDALPHLRQTPAAVALPSTAAEVQAIVRLCARAGVPFVARGHGTGLSGGALPVAGGLVIALARLNRILDVDIPNQRVTVEPGVTNLDITKQVAPFGYYAPVRRASRSARSAATSRNSGGAHRPKYGFTVHHARRRRGAAQRRARASRRHARRHRTRSPRADRRIGRRWR
jgi:glycolate oxidase